MRLLCTSLLHSSHTNGRHKLSEMVRAIPFFFPLSPQTFCATFCKNFSRKNIGFATTAISPWTLVIYGPATGGHVTPEYEKLFSYIGFLQTWHSDIHNIHIYYKKNNQYLILSMKFGHFKYPCITTGCSFSTYLSIKCLKLIWLKVKQCSALTKRMNIHCS